MSPDLALGGGAKGWEKTDLPFRAKFTHQESDKVRDLINLTKKVLYVIFIHI